MKQTRFSRRQFLMTLGLSVAAVPFVAKRFWPKGTQASALFLTASDDKAGNHYVSGFDAQGEKRFQLPTELRGHGVMANPTYQHKALMFARRPGTVLFEVNLQRGVLGQQVASAKGRHFFGHGCFSHDGRYLYTTENDFINGRGLVVVRDTFDYRIVNEFSSYGIGPHEIKILSDGTTLVVANGGIQTHPDTPRKKLNIPTMQPSLAYIDAQTGQLMDEYRLDNHKLSIRHLDVSEHDQVIAIMQYQGAKTDNVPLVAVHQGEEQLHALMADATTQPAMNQYTASTCIDSSTGVAGVTCPRGNLVTFWDTRSRQFIKALKIKDAGGITLARNGQFMVTTGRGEIHRISATSLSLDKSPLLLSDTRCDNHLSLALIG